MAGNGFSSGLLQPTEKGVVALADNYYNKYEPKLKGDNKETIDSIKTAFFMNKAVQFFMDQTISNLVTELTFSLAARKPFEVLISASALLVKTSPKDPRVINLFGAVLNSAGKDQEAMLVFQYGVSIKPRNPLLRLNLANAYLDYDKDELAKKMLDKLVFEFPEDRAVWKALAAYYYKKNDMYQFRDCLLKAAKFNGYKKKKQEEKNLEIDANSAKGNESVDQLEIEINKLATSVPYTSADVIDDEYPAQAKQIRDRYCKLQGDEIWLLPKLPQCNMETPKEYAESAPIIDAWANIFGVKSAEWQKLQVAAMGIDVKAPKAVQKAQIDKVRQAKTTEAFQNAMATLSQMKNMPGMNNPKYQAKINQAMKKFQAIARKKNVKVSTEDYNTTANGATAATQMDMSSISGPDSGSPWALANFRNYMNIQRTYEMYFFKYYKEYHAKAVDIHNVYFNKAKLENDRFDKEWDKLQEEHNQPNHPHGGEDFPCRRAQLNHKKLMNALALPYYHEWVNYYMPQYAQKMKPHLDEYWNVCMIYVRSMNDPKVMAREFKLVKNTFLAYANKAGIAISGEGGYQYYPETDEEERQLDSDIARAKEEAAQRATQYAQAFQAPSFDFSKWMEDHFVVEIAGQFFALKVTAKTIQFDVNALIFGGSIKYNPVDNILETSSSVTLKANIGVNVCGIGGTLSEKVDFYKRTATWDLDNDKYVETNGAGSEGKLKIGPATFGGKVEMDSELNAKATSKFTLFGDFTVQEQAKSK